MRIRCWTQFLGKQILVEDLTTVLQEALAQRPWLAAPVKQVGLFRVTGKGSRALNSTNAKEHGSPAITTYSIDNNYNRHILKIYHLSIYLEKWEQARPVPVPHTYIIQFPLRSSLMGCLLMRRQLWSIRQLDSPIAEGVVGCRLKKCR